jgi:hypothetical protein
VNAPQRAIATVFVALGVRGADLATKMRYQPGDKLPAIFGN